VSELAKAEVLAVVLELALALVSELVKTGEFALTLAKVWEYPRAMAKVAGSGLGLVAVTEQGSVFGLAMELEAATGLVSAPMMEQE